RRNSCGDRVAEAVVAVHLIKKCLDANPLNRPTAKEIEEILHKWFYKLTDNQTKELQRQVKEVEKINNNLTNTLSVSSKLSYQTHSEAIYTSKLLNFNNLTEQINSDDYYYENDNIISMKLSARLSLQIDISPWNINESGKPVNIASPMVKIKFRKKRFHLIMHSVYIKYFAFNHYNPQSVFLKIK
ncbi:hypothetical protein RhiirC2_800834, partial [Rhizophagus irregularis]